MGVRGLWKLSAPSVAVFQSKSLSVKDWALYMDDSVHEGDEGREGRNGTFTPICWVYFRRICKFLYLRWKPIFVFDGQRENAQTRIKKTAEKLLLNQHNKLGN